MKDGYYLSTYMLIDGVSNLVGHVRGHDQSVALWLKEGLDVSLVHYWELERRTGLKEHMRGFWNRADATGFVNGLLGPNGMSLSDMVEVWGTPGLQTVDDYHSLADHPDLCYHSLANLFSGLLLDTDFLNSSNVLALAVDAGPPVIAMDS